MRNFWKNHNRGSEGPRWNAKTVADRAKLVINIAWSATFLSEPGARRPPVGIFSKINPPKEREGQNSPKNYQSRVGFFVGAMVGASVTQTKRSVSGSQKLVLRPSAGRQTSQPTLRSCKTAYNRAECPYNPFPLRQTANNMSEVVFYFCKI